MDSTDSSSGYQNPQLPPGFRFHPTDEELVVHYLKRKAASAPLPVAIIADVDLYKFDPWELPSKAAFGEQEWYFFSPRDRKYPNGARPNRAATSGYWKATGTDKPILSSDGQHQKVGVKKALVFYGGKPPKGVKTNWIMHEYRLIDNASFNSFSKPPLSADPASHTSKKNSLRLDNWVLCRIYKKSNSSINTILQRPPLMEQDKELSMDAMLPTISTLSMANTNSNTNTHHQHSNPPIGLDNDDNFFDGILRGGGGGGVADSQSHHMVSSNSNSSKGSSFPPMKRPLASPFWHDTGSPISGSSSSTKRFHGDLNSTGISGTGTAEENSSFVSLLSQLPPQTNPTFHHPNNALLGSVEDAVLRQQFQLPTLNWNS